jgi:hypothetical protein
MSQQIFELVVRGGEIGCTYRPVAAGFALTSTLGSVTVLACCAKGVQGELYELLRVDDDANDLSDSDAEAKAGLEPHTFDKVLKFRFEKLPLPVGPEPIGDILINVVMGGVICDLRPHAIKQLLNFIEPITKASLPEITDMAYNIILEAREQARAGMELAVASRLTINLRAIVRAPRIFITADQDMSCDTDEAAILVVDMGLLDVRSEVKEQIEDPSSLSRGELERLMYDTYPVTLHGMQIVMLESLDDASAFCSREDTTMHIVPKTTIFGCLGRRLRSNDIKLPQFKVALSIEHLKVALSDSKIYTAALLVERFLSAVHIPSPLAQLFYGINTAQCDQPVESTTSEPRQLQRLRYGSAQPTMKDLAALWADSEYGEEQSQDVESSIGQDDGEAVTGLEASNGSSTTGPYVQPSSPNGEADGAAEESSRASSVYTTPQNSPLPLSSTKNDQIRAEAARAQRQLEISQALARQVDVTLSVTTVVISIAKQDKHSGRQSDLLQLTLHALSLQLSTRHYDQRVNVSLSGATLESLANQSTDDSSESYFIFYTFPEPIGGRNVPDNSILRAAMQATASQESTTDPVTQSGEKKTFLEINMSMCDRRSPLFAEHHNRTELDLDIHSTHMTVCVEQIALIDAAERLFPFVNAVLRRVAGIALAEGTPSVHELRRQAMISEHRQHQNQRPAHRGSDQEGSNAGWKNADGTKDSAGENPAGVDSVGPAGTAEADEVAVKSMVASISLAGAHLCLAKRTKKLCTLDVIKLEATIVCWRAVKILKWRRASTGGKP